MVKPILVWFKWYNLLSVREVILVSFLFLSYMEVKACPQGKVYVYVNYFLNMIFSPVSMHKWW